MNFPFYIAHRLHSAGDIYNKVSKPVIRIAVASVAIGLAVMIISVSVVLGFKHTVRDMVVGFAGNIQVADFATLQTVESKPVAVGDSMMAVLHEVVGVSHVQRTAVCEGILKTDADFLGVMFKGVGEEFDTTFIASRMIDGSLPRFGNVEEKNHIAISKATADKLLLKAGDRVFAYFVSDEGVRMRRFTISGVYQTNLIQYDDLICFAPISTIQRLNGWDEELVTNVELHTSTYEQTDATTEVLMQTVQMSSDGRDGTFVVKTVREINPQIFSWLDLLDLNVWIILIIMLLVAAVTMVSGILIIILERSPMIGTLKALGAKNSSVRHTFIYYSAFISLKGIVWGNMLGIGLCLLQTATHIVTLDPTIYYVDSVPVEMNITLIVLLNVATLVLTVFATVVPTFVVSKIHPAKAMKME